MGLLKLTVVWLLSVRLLLSWYSAAASLSLDVLDVLDVYPPLLPKFVAQEDTIVDLELRVYFPATADATSTGVRVTPTCASLVFTPSSFLFDASVQSVYRFSLEPLANGTFLIEYRAQEEALTQSTSGLANGSKVLFNQAIRVLEPPRAFELSDREWTGVILRNDSFDQRVGNYEATSVPYSSPLWSHLLHGYPSSACGSVDGDRALYFTSLGDRFAVTSPLNLLGFHGKMHFYHVYGFKKVQSYDAVGDNLISCELVDAEEETVLSFLPPGQDSLNKSAWEPIYEVPLAQLMGNFSNHSVSLPLSAMHSAAQFRWEQKNHSSFPLDVATGLTTEAILGFEDDLTGVNGQLGLEEREVWRYRNLFDQWALDNVRLEVRLNVPLFFLEDATPQTPGVTRVVVMSPIANTWVEYSVGNGTHAFPSCSNTTQALNNSNTSSTRSVAQLNVSGYVHAVACLQVNASLISSFPARSSRFLVQAQVPRITTSLSSSTSIDRWSVVLACDGCDFMRYTLLSTAESSSSTRNIPSCSYGSLVNGTSLLVPVTSNAKLQVVACGAGLVASDLVKSSELPVRPRVPTFAFVDPKTTATGAINVTIVPSDISSLKIIYFVGSESVPGALSCAASRGTIPSAGNRTIQVNVWDVIHAVACCMDRTCEDSDVAVWGPLGVNALAPVSSMACSRVKPLTMVVYVKSATTNAEIRYSVDSGSSLTCATGTNYTKPIEVALTSTAVYAISCRQGLEASSVTVIQVNLDACCAGLDAYNYPSCAHVLLLADDFTNCVDATKWARVTSQWGGDDVNGGVHADNVACVKNQALGKNVLVLGAHGDLYPGTTPVGSRMGAADGVLRERTLNDSAFLEWALEGANSVPCNQRDRCPARRVGAAVATKLELNAGILVIRLKPCDAFGTLTQLWWGKYEDKQLFAQQEVPFLPLWKAALYQAKTTSDVPFVVSSPLSSVANATRLAAVGADVSSSEGFMEIGMQWNASEGRTNLYVNGALVLKQNVSQSMGASLFNSTLSLGVWFPNAIAGEPLFESCNVLVDRVQVFKMEIAGGRWCDFDKVGAAHTISCVADVDCQTWVTQNCFMGIYEASCTAHYDELGAFPNANAQELDVAAAVGEDIPVAPAMFCHFRLQPTTYSSVSSTEMTARDQLMHLSDEE